MEYARLRTIVDRHSFESSHLSSVRHTHGECDRACESTLIRIGRCSRVIAGHDTLIRFSDSPTDMLIATPISSYFTHATYVNIKMLGGGEG